MTEKEYFAAAEVEKVARAFFNKQSIAEGGVINNVVVDDQVAGLMGALHARGSAVVLTDKVVTDTDRAVIDDAMLDHFDPHGGLDVVNTQVDPDAVEVKAEVES